MDGVEMPVGWIGGFQEVRENERIRCLVRLVQTKIESPRSATRPEFVIAREWRERKGCEWKSIDLHRRRYATSKFQWGRGKHIACTNDPWRIRLGVFYTTPCAGGASASSLPTFLSHRPSMESLTAGRRVYWPLEVGKTLITTPGRLHTNTHTRRS